MTRTPPTSPPDQPSAFRRVEGTGEASGRVPPAPGSREPSPSVSAASAASIPSRGPTDGPAKASYVGAPAVFALKLACQQIAEAFDDPDDFCGCYMVGSALERSNWRDVDVRFIMGDASFKRLFPDAGDQGWWEHDPRWLLMTISISAWLSKVSGLPIDFQFQPMTHANERHKGRRDCLDMKTPKSRGDA